MSNNLFQSGGGGGGIVASPEESIAAGGEVSSAASGSQYRPISGNGGPVSASLTPFGTSLQWASGSSIVLRGTNAVNTVSFTHNDAIDGMILNGNATLGESDILEVIYDSTLERWIERGRNF